MGFRMTTRAGTQTATAKGPLDQQQGLVSQSLKGSYPEYKTCTKGAQKKEGE